MVKLTSRLNPEAHKEKQPEKSILVSENERNLSSFLTEVVSLLYSLSLVNEISSLFIDHCNCFKICPAMVTITGP